MSAYMHKTQSIMLCCSSNKRKTTRMMDDDEGGLQQDKEQRSHARSQPARLFFNELVGEITHHL